MTADLTIGKPSRVLWRFCLPMFASIVFQQLYNIADSLVAGRFIGENALAAVGNSYEITLIYLAFSFGCNVACSILVSFYFGAKELKNVHTTVSTTAIASGILCLLLVIFGFFSGSFLLQVIRTPESIFADSLLYLRIYIIGFPFVMFYNIATGIFSGLGDSRTPFLFLAFSSTANIIMDVIFVTVFSMGVAGVAWATLICQGISCILALGVIFIRLKKMGCKEGAPLFSFAILKRLAGVAIPSTLQQSFISVGNIIIQGVINGFGPAVIAGYSASVKLNNLVITSFTTLGNGVSNYTSQNIGAGKIGRVQKGFRAGVGIVWLICIPLAVLYFFRGDLLIRFFMSEPTQGAMHTGIQFLRILSPFYFVISAKLVADGILKGSQKMNWFMIVTFSDLILRVLLALFLSKTALGSTGIWLAWPIGWSVAAAMSLLFCRRVWQQQPEGQPEPLCAEAEEGLDFEGA